MTILTHLAEIVFSILFYLQLHWKAIIGYGGYMLAGTSLLQYIKRKYEIDKAKGFSFLGLWKMDGPRIMAALYTVFTGFSTVATFFMNPNNAAILPTRFAFLFAAGYYLHRFLVSPTSTKLEAKIKPYIEALQELQKLQTTIVKDGPDKALSGLLRSAETISGTVSNPGILAQQTTATPAPAVPPSKLVQ